MGLSLAGICWLSLHGSCGYAEHLPFFFFFFYSFFEFYFIHFFLCCQTGAAMTLLVQRNFFFVPSRKGKPAAELAWLVCKVPRLWLPSNSRALQYLSSFCLCCENSLLHSAEWLLRKQIGGPMNGSIPRSSHSLHVIAQWLARAKTCKWFRANQKMGSVLGDLELYTLTVIGIKFVNLDGLNVSPPLPSSTSIPVSKATVNKTLYEQSVFFFPHSSTWLNIRKKKVDSLTSTSRTLKESIPLCTAQM